MEQQSCSTQEVQQVEGTTNSNPPSDPPVPVPVTIHVTKNNWKNVRSFFIECFEGCSFYSFDTEFSGLGESVDKQKRTHKDLDERYTYIASNIGRYTPFQLGFTFFKRLVVVQPAPHSNGGNVNQKDGNSDLNHFEATTFNFWVFSSQDFQCSSESLTFLTESGLDFNFLFTNGIPIYPKALPLPPALQKKLQQNLKQNSNSKQNSSTAAHSGKTSEDIQNSFVETVHHLMTQYKKTLVLHNGLIDIMYMHYYFFQSFPLSLLLFVNNITEYFPTVYDTKYLVDYHLDEDKSWLAYLYKKYDRRNNKEPGVSILRNTKWNEIEREQNNNINTENNKYNKNQKTTTKKSKKVCVQFMNHGFCSSGIRCEENHDVEVILNYEENLRVNKKRKREDLIEDAQQDDGVITSNLSRKKQKKEEKQQQAKEQEEEQQQEFEEQQQEEEQIQTTIPRMKEDQQHSAGFDSFATGFVFCDIMNRLGREQVFTLRNNIYLIAKDRPLRLIKSK